MRRFQLPALILSVLCNVLLLAIALHRPMDAHSIPSGSAYPFISKRLFVENQNDILINFVDLRTKLYTYKDKNQTNMGIYFEYLPSGISIGINDKENYVLASLLKVPLIMAVYGQINAGKISQDTVLTVQSEHINSSFGNLWRKGAGHQLTVREAIRLVLTESDNTAKNVVFSQLTLADLQNVFSYLDIPFESEEYGPVVTPKNYSSILRSLYLSSYLPKEQSNEILELMTQSVHRDKIVAGVDENVQVAHKIGVFEQASTPDEQIYTDCGIIYEPQRPYMLCIMVKSSKTKAIDVMKDVSTIVYDYVHSAK